MPLLVFLGIVPLIWVAIGYASSRAAGIIRTEAKENMALKGKALAESVSRWEEMQVFALHNLSRQPDIVSMNAQQQKPVLREIVETYEHLYLASTTNLDGWNVARSDDEKPKYYGDRPWFLGAKAGNELTSQTLISRTTKKPGLCLSTPIRKEKLEILGVAMLCTDLKVLAKQVGAIGFGQTGYAFVLDNMGQVLAHPDPKLLSGERLTKLTDISNYAALKALWESSSGHFSFADEQGVKWLSYGTRLKNGWRIFLLQQEAEVLEDERKFRQLAITIASVAVLGAGVLTWLLANRLIQPISALTAVAATISNGQLNQRVRIKHQDELGVLAQSFNQMAAQLQEFFEELENRVEELEQMQAMEVELRQSLATEKELSSLKSQMIATISHEFRTPLTKVLAAADLLEANLHRWNKEKQFKYIAIIQTAAEQMGALIQNVLFLRQAEADKLEFQPELLNLANYLAEIIEEMQLIADDRFQLILTCVGECEPFWGDAKGLRQILLNLLSNAIKYSPGGGKIELKLICKPTKVIIQVCDQGMGIPKSDQSHLFESFSRGSNVDTIQGTGLGLAIVKRAVELHKGTISVTSEVGCGTTFTVILPKRVCC